MLAKQIFAYLFKYLKTNCLSQSLPPLLAVYIQTVKQNKHTKSSDPVRAQFNRFHILTANFVKINLKYQIP
jgi:hypothetical protein